MSASDQLGEPVKWSRVEPPSPIALHGSHISLVELDPDEHTAALFAESLGDPRLWDYLPYGPFSSAAEYAQFLRDWAFAPGEVSFALIDQRSGRPAGVLALIRPDAVNGVVEVGHVWFGSSLQRTPAATEAIYLLGKQVFEGWGYRRFEWKCNSLNKRSKRAAERFGFSYEGCFRQHLVVKGRNRDTDWYSMLDSEWPSRKLAFEAWLQPGNFGPAGEQIKRLEDFRP